ncbi:ATP-grasp domain-containing protein [Sinomicrobium weinanense]|uniref:ATP-grasp domain-containing protein n=1 Tax=Sinomicrobium weinanense TaxID=2842200 RepID=A0A926JND2_9FLAO|nr:ATP-grasp domain-containing protein [Sinomicrobium weinanense]MBC9794465.1 ATP-grasp domain-containing protein [Sinomicrobium weinanense]MBU3124372.1 ATP-grasp domain-containing protein [Sinomicrobium weinanense]
MEPENIKDHPEPVAILYQAAAPPSKNGVRKPVKPGGYADSGADIAYTLALAGIPVITPVNQPDIYKDTDWVFPDTISGITSALHRGARKLWLNTVLYATHPVSRFRDQDIKIIGQVPDTTDLYDDKWVTNRLLKNNALPIPPAVLISEKNHTEVSSRISFPVVLKPLRGRGSEGVTVVHNNKELTGRLADIFDSGKFGNTVYAEEYLPGQEVTITVMPPGKYKFPEAEKEFSDHWCLPAVKRLHHQNGIAPYNGTVAVIRNSAVLEDSELLSDAIRELYLHCEKAASLVDARAPIRIDCRSDSRGKYHLFDLNLKPNMTGASRPHRKDQDSLTALAARKAGWNYTDLLANMLRQGWEW